MLEPVTTLPVIDIPTDRKRDAGVVEKDKAKKHKKDKKHKDEKSKKHRRDKERKSSRDEVPADFVAGGVPEEQKNGVNVNGRADSEPESGEIPVEHPSTVNEITKAPSLGVPAGTTAVLEGDPAPKVLDDTKRASLDPGPEKKRRKVEDGIPVTDGKPDSKVETQGEQNQRPRSERRANSVDNSRNHAKADGGHREHSGRRKEVEDVHKQAGRSGNNEGQKPHRESQRSHFPDRTRIEARRPHDSRHQNVAHGSHRSGERHRGESPTAMPRNRSHERLNESRRDARERWREDDRSGAFQHRSSDLQRSRYVSPSRRRDRDLDRSRRPRSRSRSRSRGPSRREREDERQLRNIVEAAIQGDGEDDEEKLIAERRARRQAILEKHQKQKEETDAVCAPTAMELQARTLVPSTSAINVASPKPSEAGESGRGSPVSDDADELADIKQEGDLWQSGAGIPDTGAQDGPDSQGESSEEKHKVENQGKRAPIDIDMFADQPESEVPDIFSGSPSDVPVVPIAQRRLQDNFDDPEGYYNFQVGEVMDSRYEVYATHGKGVFSTVLRARDLAKKNPATGTPIEVAIKVIRSNDIMYKAGQTETVILRKLAGADPEGKRHVVRFIRTFDYRSHLCLVFESMDINLRELTKKYGRGIGLNLRAVHAYAHQLLWALYHLRSCGVLHADIKPDNILVNKGRNVVKLCDFGSAMFAGDNEITPYLVSRFYRSPEVILGLKYDHAMDMWSIGCVLYELFTGKILFPGKTNNEMLKLMMDVKGPFPKKMLKKAAFADKHFNDDLNMSFALLEEDPVSRRPIRKIVANPTIKNDFSALLKGSEGEPRKVAQLADLLERMMHLDPEKRIAPKDALRHPFIKDQPKAAG